MAIKKILIVDDSPTERHILAKILTRNSYHVIMAENGEQALAKAREDKPDLVLMDVVMPGINGFQATRLFLKDRSVRDIPIIICSTKGQEIDRIWGLRQGARDYVVKPVDAAELLQNLPINLDSAMDIKEKQEGAHNIKEAKDTGTTEMPAMSATVLGLSIGDDRYLVHMKEISEVIQVPEIVSVPLTQLGFWVLLMCTAIFMA